MRNRQGDSNYSPDRRTVFIMTKLILWVLILLGVALPFGLATIAFSLNQKTKLPSRYTRADAESSEDPVMYNRYAWLALGGYRITINTSVYPPFIIIAGIGTLLWGTFLLFHVGTGSVDSSLEVLTEYPTLDRD